MPKYSKRAGEKVERAMHEKKAGTLKSGRSGKKVTSRKQAIAIGLSEAREEGAKVPRKSGAKKTGAKKTSAKKTGAKKTSAKKTSAKKSSAKKSAPKKAAKKSGSRSTGARKTGAKKTARKGAKKSSR